MTTDSPVSFPGRSADLLALGLLSALWWLPALWVGVHGNFPLYDDWAYARAVQTWHETGSFARPNFILAPTLSNAVVGLAASKLLGFSFETLRLSNLLMGWLAVLAAYGLARQLRARQEVALLSAACLAVCPLFFHLAYTFMTDVGFAAFTTAGLLSASRLLERPSLRSGALLLLFSAAAVLSRNPGLALPAAAGAAALLVNLRRPAVWVGSLVAGLVFFGIYWFSPLLFGAEDSGTRFPVALYLRYALCNPSLPYNLVRNLVTGLYLLGLCLAPIWLMGGLRDLGRPGWAVVGVTTLLGTAGLLSLGVPPPFSMDQIRDLGLGAMTLHGNEILPRAPAFVWVVAPMVGFAAGAGALWRIVRFFWHERRDQRLLRASVPLMVFFVGYLGAFSIQWPFFDRWLIPALPPLAALLAAATPTESRTSLRAGALAVVAALFAFSVVGTRDQLDLHRTRQALIAQVEESGIPPERLDGGSVYNGWHHYRSIGEEHHASPLTGHRWVQDDEVVISYAEALPGYEVIASTQTRMRLPPASVTVRAFRREREPEDLAGSAD